MMILYSLHFILLGLDLSAGCNEFLLEHWNSYDLMPLLMPWVSVLVLVELVFILVECWGFNHLATAEWLLVLLSLPR